MNRVDVVLPVYDEAAALPSFLAALRARLDAEGLDWRIHLCVDRSNDGTEAVVEKACEGDRRMRALLFTGRFGHQESLFAGLAAARRDAAVLMMDADGQHPPEVIPELLAAWRCGADVVLTRRLETEGQSASARFLSDNFYRVLSRLSSLPLEPGMADFRLLAPDVASALRDGFPEQAPFLRGLISWMGYRPTIVSYRATHRIAGHSKYTLRKRIRFARHAILAFSAGPLRWSLPAGLALAAVALLYAAFLLVGWLAGGGTPNGTEILAAALGLFSGVQLAFLGVVGEYLANVYGETRRRPRWIVRKAVNYDDGEVRRIG